jgi:hypothetical protein
MARRAYVKVVVEFSPEGKIVPLSVEWEDGRRFDVDRLLDVRRAASTRVGGTGMRYTVRILGHETYLFEDRGRWFVEARD